MKRLVLALCLVMLAPSATLAEAPSLQCSSRNAMSHEFAPAGQLPQSAGEHLFFDAEDLASKADLELRFFLDGQLHLSERLPLKSLKPAAEPGDGAPPGTVVELLAMRPAERKLLATISRTEPDRVNVEIWQEGTLLRSIPFAQLQQESEALTETSFRPEVVRSQVSGKGKREQLQKLSGLPVEPATCEGGCILNRDQCYASSCPQIDSCEDCEWEYQQCINACQPPPPPPTCKYREQYYWTEFYVVSRTPVWGNQICFHDQIFYFYDGLWHVRVETTYRRDYIKKTTYVNCSTSQQVINYEYGYSWCYAWTNSACYNSLFPFNRC